MNNLNYFPFKRNRYYNGKLLSVSDFEAEQRYFNDKRRLSNRLLHGFGVVCGMQVVAVSADQLSVEPGVALDGYGREIVVTKPDVRRLVDLEGYDPDIAGARQYLYVEYDERMTDEVRPYEQPLDEGTHTACYNSIAEQYALYLSDRSPEENPGTLESYYSVRGTVYRDDMFRLDWEMPRYLLAGTPFYLTFRLTPREPAAPFQLRLRVMLHCIRQDGKDFIQVEQDNRNTSWTGQAYEFHCLCQCMNITEDLAQVRIERETFTLSPAGRSGSLTEAAQLQAEVTNRPTEECAAREYESRIFQYAAYRPCRDICLAAVDYDDKGSIRRVWELPFGQRAYSTAALALENMALKDRLAWMEQRLMHHEQDTNVAEQEELPIAMSSGDASIPLGIGGNTGRRFFSSEIAHGLGLGKVTIVLGVEENDAEKGGVVYGSSEIFDETPGAALVETAVRLDPAKGTFVIGIRLLEPLSQFELKIHWTAFRYYDRKQQSQEKKILINIPAKSIRVMESVYLSAKFIHMAPSDLIWSVVGENSGSINANGCYTAPNHPGVYEVRATCAYDPELIASAFLVIKP